MIYSRKTIAITIFLTLFVNQSDCKFSLGKIKDKIESGFRSATKATKNTFNKLIKKTEKENKMTPAELSKEKLFDAIENIDSANIKGLNVYDRRLEMQIKKANKFIENAFWAKEKDFIDTFEQSFEFGAKEPQEVLYEKLLLIYPNEKSPLVKFAVDMDSEHEKTKDFIETIGSFNKNLLEDKKKGEELDFVLSQLEEFVILLDKLIFLTNELLKI